MPSSKVKKYTIQPTTPVSHTFSKGGGICKFDAVVKERATTSWASQGRVKVAWKKPNKSRKRHAGKRDLDLGKHLLKGTRVAGVVKSVKYGGKRRAFKYC
jgi:hypothetical protein